MSRRIRQPGEPEDEWEELRDGLAMGFHILAAFLVVFGASFSVGFALSRCGVAGYFLAYFVVFYLPNFWILVFHPSDKNVLKRVDLAGGAIAVLALGVNSNSKNRTPRR